MHLATNVRLQPSERKETYDVYILIVAEYVQERNNILVPYKIHDDDVLRHFPVYRVLFPVLRGGILLHEFDRNLMPVLVSAGLAYDTENTSSEFRPKLVSVDEVLEEVIIVGEVRGYCGTQDRRRVRDEGKLRDLRWKMLSNIGLAGRIITYSGKELRRNRFLADKIRSLQHY